MGMFAADRFMGSGDRARSQGSDSISAGNPALTASPDQQGSANELTIAVLPFVNMSSDPEQEFFSDGITEEILNTLVKVPDLLVTARTSSFSYKGQQQDVRTIGQALGVYHILEGSVRKAGNQLRITAQLIRVEDGFHLWSETYDRQLENVFVIQEEIATAIAEALKAPLGLAVKDLVPNRMQNIAAYEQFLRARRLSRQRDRYLEEAHLLLQQVLEQEPEFAPAWALMSIFFVVAPGYLTTLGGEKVQVPVMLELAAEAARKAVDLDPELASAQHALGNVLRARRQWQAAEDAYRKAYELDDSSIDIIEDYRQFFLLVGRLGEAIKLARRGFDLEPGSALAAMTVCDVLIAQNQLEEAKRYCNIALEIQPGFTWPLGQSAEIALIEGDLQAAYRLMSVCTTCRQLDGDYQLDIVKSLIDGEKTVVSDDRLFLGFQTTIWYTVGGEELMLDGFAHGIQQLPGTDHRLFYVNPPFMVSIRQTRRYKDLIIEVGLPDYWRQRGWSEFCRPLGDDDFECENGG
jgi:TolB-like protein